MEGGWYGTQPYNERTRHSEVGIIPEYLYPGRDDSVRQALWQFRNCIAQILMSLSTLLKGLILSLYVGAQLRVVETKELRNFLAQIKCHY